MLPKNNRVLKQSFSRVYKNGSRISSQIFQMVFLKTDDKPSRFAIIVSTRINKHAVVRNRIKRVVRESIKHHLSHIKPGFDVILVCKKNCVSMSQSEIELLVTKMLLSGGIMEESSYV